MVMIKAVLAGLVSTILLIAIMMLITFIPAVPFISGVVLAIMFGFLTFTFYGYFAGWDK